MPGFDREVTAPGVLRRVYEAIYVRVLAPADEILPPSDEGMQRPRASCSSGCFGRPRAGFSPPALGRTA